MGAVAAIVGFTASVQANSIQGSVGFTGTYVQNGGTDGDLSTATSFTINNTISQPITISSATIDFIGATTPTFYSPITVTPLPSAYGVSIPLNTQLWSVLVGSKTYDLLVTSAIESFRDSTQVNLKGTGTLRNGTPGDDTAGTWQIGFGVSGASFTWQSTSAANVPDGATTAMLLGSSLTMLGLVRRNRK